MSKIRSVRARIGTSGGAASKDDPPGAVEQPANIPLASSDARSRPRRFIRPGSSNLGPPILPKPPRLARPWTPFKCNPAASIGRSGLSIERENRPIIRHLAIEALGNPVVAVGHDIFLREPAETGLALLDMPHAAPGSVQHNAACGEKVAQEGF